MPILRNVAIRVQRVHWDRQSRENAYVDEIPQASLMVHWDAYSGAIDWRVTGDLE